MEPVAVALQLASALDKAGISYAIGGAHAYAYWGVARATHDVDLNLFITWRDLDPALEVLAAAGLEIDRQAALGSAEERGDARGRVGDVPVDIFVNSIPLQESAAGRTVQVDLLDQPIRILSAEDLVALKMLFFRGKDVVDVERVVAMQGSALDRDYVRRWLVDSVSEDDPRLAKWDEICRILDE